MKKSFLLIILIGCFISSCITNQETKIESIELNDWHILGPFKSDNQKDYLQFNNLQPWGFTEEQIDYTSFIHLEPDSGLTNSIYNEDLTVLNFCKHFGLDPNNSIEGNVYAACYFDVKDTSDYYINFTSDDGGKVYLNNREIINLEKASLMENYEIYKPVKLKKGKNFLLVKVNNGFGEWQAFVRIEKYTQEGMKKHSNIMSRLAFNKFFKYTVYDTSNILVPSVSLPGTQLKLEIFSKDDSLVYSGQVYKNQNIYPDISELPNGLFKIRLCVGDQELIQDIYKGNLEQAIKEKINQLENRKTTNEELRATIDANVYRFNHLIKPSNRGVDFAEKLQWQRKLIYIFKTLVEIEKRIDQNKPLQGIPNIALMAYVSKIDNEDQFYVSHAPRDYNPNIQYPVVIFATIRAASNLQYLESRKIADMDKLEILQYLADKYQMIVVQPWNREVARFNFNSIGETDLFEVLSSVKSNYNVDTTRIFITGTCEGGDKAIKFAVRYPHLFAGVGLVSPAFNINPFENEWHKKSLPFDNIENLANTPILNIHSESDSHNSIMNSLYLEQLANHSNLEHFSFIRLDNIMEDFYFYKYSEKIFEFFSGITPIEQANSSSLSISDLKYNTNHIITILERNNQGVSKVSLKLKNNKIHISSSNVKNYSLRLNRLSINRNKPIIVFDNGELLFEGPIPDNSIIVKKKIVDPNQVLKNNHVSGPLADIFTNRFIIVVGSIGTPEQTKINEINAQFFNDSWNEKYFSNCMIKYDYQIDESDIKTANLLLVGNFESNQILKNLDGEIPLSIKDDMIKIGNYTETGKNLNLYFIYPNPKNVNKYIGVFSGGTKQDKYATMIDISEYEYNSLLNMYGEDSLYFDISCFGWYDYKVWNDSGINLYSGYFNDSWQNDR